jgi:hypothetical protein
MNLKTTVMFAGIALGGATAAQPAQAQGSMQNLSQAMEHSALASAHAVAGSAQLVSGVVAVPLLVVGSVGAASQQAGEALWEVANSPIGTPLPISEHTVTVGPSPDKAIQE